MSAQAIDSPTNSALAGRLGLERTLTLVARLREVGILLVLLAVVAIVTIQAPLFFSVSNFEQILLNVSLIAIVAVGQTTVVLTRNVDLSVGSMVGLVAFATGDLLKENTLGVPGARSMRLAATRLLLRSSESRLTASSSEHSSSAVFARELQECCGARGSGASTHWRRADSSSR